jgi:hypothetical protein
MRGRLEVLQKIWVLAKENQTTEEIKNNLLLVTNSEVNTTLILAAKMGKQDLLQEIWDWVVENLTTE